MLSRSQSVLRNHSKIPFGFSGAPSGFSRQFSAISIIKSYPPPSIKLQRDFFEKMSCIGDFRGILLVFPKDKILPLQKSHPNFHNPSLPLPFSHWLYSLNGLPFLIFRFEMGNRCCCSLCSDFPRGVFHSEGNDLHSFRHARK